MDLSGLAVVDRMGSDPQHKLYRHRHHDDVVARRTYQPDLWNLSRPHRSRSFVCFGLSGIFVVSSHAVGFVQCGRLNQGRRVGYRDILQSGRGGFSALAPILGAAVDVTRSYRIRDGAGILESQRRALDRASNCRCCHRQVRDQYRQRYVNRVILAKHLDCPHFDPARV